MPAKTPRKRRGNVASPPDKRVPPDVSVAEFVLKDVIDRLSFSDLKNAFEKAILSLLKLGDETTAVDLETVAVLAGIAKLPEAKDAKVVLGGHTFAIRDFDFKSMTVDDATLVLGELEGWLHDLEAACEFAWTASGTTQGRSSFRLPLALLRGILIDLKEGNNTIWTALSPRAKGDRADDNRTRAVKKRAAQTIKFLRENGFGKLEAYSLVSDSVAAAGKRLGGLQSPLPSEPRLSRLVGGVQPLPEELSTKALSLLTQTPIRAQVSCELAAPVVELLMSEPVRAYFTAPRVNAGVILHRRAGEFLHHG